MLLTLGTIVVITMAIITIISLIIYNLRLQIEINEFKKRQEKYQEQRTRLCKNITIAQVETRRILRGNIWFNKYTKANEHARILNHSLANVLQSLPDTDKACINATVVLQRLNK